MFVDLFAFQWHFYFVDFFSSFFFGAVFCIKCAHGNYNCSVWFITFEVVFTCLIIIYFYRDDAVVVEPVAAPLGETMDLMTALQLVLRKSLAHGGLVRGLHEGAKAIEKHAAQLCVMAEDCNQPDYLKLVKALCADHNVSLISVPSAKTLGEWAGVSTCSLLTFICSLFI